MVVKGRNNNNKDTSDVWAAPVTSQEEYNAVIKRDGIVGTLGRSAKQNRGDRLTTSPLPLPVSPIPPTQ